MQTYSYLGELISRNSNIAGLRWQCHCNGMFLYADTLEGIKQLIKEEVAA
jgi:hypothetical protein